jgi:choline dehydrogenase-like flavoprotein
VAQDLLEGAGFHLLGTARMGDDPATSVVDRWCRAHSAPNLMVVDGSVFVTAAALNPTPTIQALALRAADALLRDRAGMETAA